MFDQLRRKFGWLLKLRGKLFVIIFLLISGLLAWWISENAKSKIPCPMDNVPVQMLNIWDGPVTTLSEVNKFDFPPGFSTFMMTVTNHLAVKLAKEKLCLNSNESKGRSLLQFAPWPVNSARDPLPSVPPLSDGSWGVCRITSPWVVLVVEQKPVPSVRAIFIFSERQLLADQAMLAGARDVPPGVAMPLSHEEFIRYTKEYERSEVSGGPAEKPIEERVPPDLLWLFRRADQVREYGLPSSAIGYMRVAIEARSEEYTEIIIGLIDRCFESEGANIHYDSILDIDDPILLEKYRIISLVMPESEN